MTQALAESADRKLHLWQRIVLSTLVVGYCGYYICRSNLSVVSPILTGASGPGLDAESLGKIASIGTFCYAVGKVFSGVLCDFVGGKRLFIIAMLGSVACTVAFGASSGFATLVVFWSLNRLIQSGGWGAAVKLLARWFPHERHGSVGGILSLSFLFGDALARLLLGFVLKFGFSWRGVFYFAAGALGAIAIASTFLIKSTPAEVGASEPATSDTTVYGAADAEPAPESVSGLLGPLLRSLSFWLACVLSVGLTFIRETFYLWTPVFLKDTAGLSDANAALGSALFPFAGGLAVLATGYLSDRLGHGHRGAIMTPCLILLAPALWALTLGERLGSATALCLIFGASFLLLGPYAFLAGAIALDLGGKKGSATAAGFIDAAGYFAAVLSGFGIGKLAKTSGWGAAFAVLSATAAASAVAAAIYWAHERRIGATPISPDPA